MKKLFDASILRFILVGIGNTLLSALLMFLFEGLGYWPSTAIAYALSSVMSFFLNRSFTFKSDAPIGPAAVRFAVNVVVCYLIAYSLAQPLAGWALDRTAIPAIWQERLTKLGGMVLFTCLNYCGQRFFAFRKKDN